MARSISDEEVQLRKRARRRLVGAVVIATAVAVLLPMVLDREPRPVSHNINVQIPSPASGTFMPKAAPPPSGPAPHAPQPPATPRPAAAKPAASPTPEEKREVPPHAASSATRAKPVAATLAARRKETRPPAKPTAKPATKAAASRERGRYAVQVAALADVAHAKRLEERVARAGLRAYTQVISTTKGKVTRVRAGPYATREAAEQARSRLKEAGLNGRIVPTKP